MTNFIDSKFFNDHSEGNHGKETILTYWLSWTLRLAVDNNDYCKNKPILRRHCRFMLFKLLGIEHYNGIHVLEVKVKKEWHRIDLIAEVVIEQNGCKERHILMMENKAYTNMTENQRDNYPSIVTRYHGNPQEKNYTLHQVLLTCFEWSNPNDVPRIKYLEDFCANSPQWHVMSIEDIMTESNRYTESELYNTFWMGNWNCIN